jgi:hypothetical protein
MLTESFPDESGRTTGGWGIEHRSRDGARDNGFWTDRAQTPATGGGPRPAHDDVAPGPVTAAATSSVNAVDVTIGAQTEPDAAGAIVRYAEGDVPPATPEDGLPGGRSVAGHLRFRHLQADTTYSISVFPVDWSGNIGPRTVTAARTPHAVATTLQVSGVPQFIHYGRTIVAKGTLTREDNGGPVVGAQVHLFGHLRDQPDRFLATLTSDSAGVVTSRRLPSGETRYTFRYAGADPLQPAATDAITHVRTVVRADLSRSTVSRGVPVTVHVRLLPAMVGRHVYVEQRLNGTVRRRTIAVSDANGTVSVRLYTGSRATYSITAFTFGDSLRTYGISPPRTLTIS